jgi:hypothetical protein
VVTGPASDDVAPGGLRRLDRGLGNAQPGGQVGLGDKAAGEGRVHGDSQARNVVRVFLSRT